LTEPDFNPHVSDSPRHDSASVPRAVELLIDEQLSVAEVASVAHVHHRYALRRDLERDVAGAVRRPIAEPLSH